MSYPSDPDRLTLDARDEDALSGRLGEGPRMAMRVVVAMADAVGAERAIDVTSPPLRRWPYQGPGRRGLVGVGGSVPRGRRDPRGPDPRRCARRWRGRSVGRDHPGGPPASQGRP